jgi:Fur family ferric uptake transcriptional regulator
MGELAAGSQAGAQVIMPGTEILEYMKDAGFRDTASRRAVVTAAVRLGRFTAAEIVDELRDSGIGRATVFRTLDLLITLGMLDQLHTDHRHPYTVCSPRHHHHLVCSSCSKVTEVTLPSVERTVRALAAKAGYQLEGHLLEITGLCAECQEAKRQPLPAS